MQRTLKWGGSLQVMGVQTEHTLFLFLTLPPLLKKKKNRFTSDLIAEINIASVFLLTSQQDKPINNL